MFENLKFKYGIEPDFNAGSDDEFLKSLKNDFIDFFRILENDEDGVIYVYANINIAVDISVLSEVHDLLLYYFNHSNEGYESFIKGKCIISNEYIKFKILHDVYY